MVNCPQAIPQDSLREQSMGERLWLAQPSQTHQVPAPKFTSYSDPPPVQPPSDTAAVLPAATAFLA
eukprot:2581998-Rhodomonas_salina.1